MEEFFQYVAPDEGAWPSKWFVYGLPRESVIDRCVQISILARPYVGFPSSERQ